MSNNNNNNNANQKENPTNVVAYPDYGVLAKQQTNTTILEYFLSFLSKRNRTPKKFGIMIFDLILIIFVKILLEESGTYLDKFKFTNVDYLRYQYQYLKNSEIKYELTLSSTSQKWSYNTTNICMNSLSPVLEKKGIYVSQPNTYYYTHQTFFS